MTPEAVIFTQADMFYFLGGLLGTGARLALSTTQPTWSIRLIVEVVVGGIGGLAIGSLGITEHLPFIGEEFASLSPKGKALAVFFLSLTGSYVYRTLEHRNERRKEHSS